MILEMLAAARAKRVLLERQLHKAEQERLAELAAAMQTKAEPSKDYWVPAHSLQRSLHYLDDLIKVLEEELASASASVGS